MDFHFLLAILVFLSDVQGDGALLGEGGGHQLGGLGPLPQVLQVVVVVVEEHAELSLLLTPLIDLRLGRRMDRERGRDREGGKKKIQICMQNISASDTKDAFCQGTHSKLEFAKQTMCST